MEQILVYINDHYSQQITLQDLEENFFLNKSYICRIFRKTMGISLVNYLQYKRILEAQKLLLNSDMPIIEIGMECGFTSVQHFYRVFKKITGLTPKEYKKNQLHTSLGQSISLLPRNPNLADGVQKSNKQI
ncbi:MAG TPA: helix-turn-helix transcriptional regulator [Candidatus Limivivens intestinipullorum]|uniref:Helix-turn-helix transcriptional regulator n=1 Tax=Candidatus Limivivens intestinipullorum TaxID=2840858 RepID=A0A9D1EVY8_9FIRM|nr:helix-turn-helix transcriptional regulator [Candidatus Limivivens intestinipullorum]